MQLFAQAVFWFSPIVRIDKLSNSNPLKSSWVFIMTKDDCAVCLNKLVFINVTIPFCIVVTRSLYRSDHVITSWYSLWWYLSLYPGCADKELVEKFYYFFITSWYLLTLYNLALQVVRTRCLEVTTGLCSRPSMWGSLLILLWTEIPCPVNHWSRSSSTRLLLRYELMQHWLKLLRLNLKVVLNIVDHSPQLTGFFI